MASLRLLALDQPGYPQRLLDLEKPPASIVVAGPMPAGKTCAVVGTRKPTPEALAFTRQLAQAIVEHGGIVVSGGAVGIDAAAHEGALDAGGKTWAIAATGHTQVFPPEHARLFDRIAADGGAMIWPFEASRKADPLSFFSRNGVLVALSETVVVVQAGIPSGALNAAAWARRLGRPTWAVCPPPWTSGFAGCALMLDRGARPLTSVGMWLRAVGLVRSGSRGRTTSPPTSTAISTAAEIPSSTPLLDRALTPSERVLLDALSATRQHVDEIAAKSGLCIATVATALLTLALENVVVEGPEGFFRRTKAG
jgi:DNA processing protein